MSERRYISAEKMVDRMDPFFIRVSLSRCFVVDFLIGWVICAIILPHTNYSFFTKNVVFSATPPCRTGAGPQRLRSDGHARLLECYRAR